MTRAVQLLERQHTDIKTRLIRALAEDHVDLAHEHGDANKHDPLKVAYRFILKAHRPKTTWTKDCPVCRLLREAKK